MNSKSLQGALRRVVTGLGFKKRVTMHTLRHSYATHLLEAGVGLRLLQQYLGHKSMATTYVYCHLTKMGHDAARSAIDGLMDRKGDGNGDPRSGRGKSSSDMGTSTCRSMETPYQSGIAR